MTQPAYPQPPNVVIAGTQGPPGPVADNVAALASLASLPLNPAAFLAGSLVGYTPAAGGPTVYYQWAPGSTATPNGSSIVAGNGGNWLLVIGAGGNGLQSKATSYQLAQFDNGADFTATGLTCTMPTSPVPFWPYFVSVGSSGNLTVSGGGKNINGQSTLALSGAYQSAILIYNGTEFRVY